LGAPQRRGRKEGKIVYFNKIALIGFLGSDAEARTTKNGASYTVLSLATKLSCHACDPAGA
jgi:hypothetical protein